MRILFVNNIPFNPAYGGIERVTDILTKELKERGHQVFYLCDYVKDKQILEYDFPANLFILPEIGGYQSKNNLNFYVSLLNDLCVDVVVNQRGLNFFQNEILLQKTRTVSVLHSLPDCYLRAELQHILSHPKTIVDYIKFPIKLLLYPYLRYRIKYIMQSDLHRHYSFIAEHSDAIVLLTDRYKETFLSYLSTGSSPMVIGINNPNTYPLSKLDLSRKEKIVLYVGRLDGYEKCPIRMLKIWERLYRKHQDWQLLIIGDGYERSSLQNYILERKLERVHLLGRKSSVKDYYAKAAIVCLTSQFEGWGMTLTEGMQFGCIPFTFNNYGAAYDIVDDDINGCLIPAFNIKKYANRLSSLMCDDDKRKELALAAFNKSKKFEASIIANQWESLFFSIMKKNNQI